MRRGLARLRTLARGLMVVASLFFAVQGAFAFRAQATETHTQGPWVWHAHVEDDGSRHFHVHRIDPDGGGHVDHDGKLVCCAAMSAAALPTVSSVPLPAAISADFTGLTVSLPPGLDPGGPRRPPRTPDIA